MDSSTENRSLRSFRRLPGKLTSRMRGVFPNDEERRFYKDTLKRRRTRVICLKLFANVLFLFSWSFVTSNQRTSFYTFGPLLGGDVWVDFSVYLGISCCLPLFCFLGLLREGVPVSQVWFEVFWLLGVSGFDAFLISQQTKFWPQFGQMSQTFLDDPFLTIAMVLYVLAVVALAIDILLSLLWSGFLCATAVLNHSKHPGIWFSHVQKFPWLSDQGSTSGIPRPRPSQVILGTASEPPATKSITNGVASWLTNSTMFRRIGTEPLVHSLLRGGLALIFLAALLAYGIRNCVRSPLSQFTQPQGLPTRYLTQDSRPQSTFGSISGFIALDVVPRSNFPSYTDEGRLPSPTCDDISSGIQASFTYPSTGQVVTTCKMKCNAYPSGEDFLQIEAEWACGPIWDGLKFRTLESVPDNRPYVSVVWNSSAYPARPLLNAGVSTITTTGSDISDFDAIYTSGKSPREVYRGLTFDFTAGQTLRVDVGRRRIYANRGTFLDLIGFAQSPTVYVTYPILSLVPGDASTTPQLTTLNFYPGFGAYNDELYEEYLENTVVSGLTKTGGLYTSFNVIYIIIFGRSLLAAVFGSKLISPFGALASMVQRESFRQGLRDQYPGIIGNDPKLKAEATCEFLHDYILDLKPLETPPEPDEYSTQTKESDIESAEKTPPNLPYIRKNATGSSGRIA